MQSSFPTNRSSLVIGSVASFLQVGPIERASVRVLLPFGTTPCTSSVPASEKQERGVADAPFSPLNVRHRLKVRIKEKENRA